MAESDVAQMGPSEDPGDFTVPQVVEYLAGVDDPGERSRVYSLEAAGQDRKGIAQTVEPEPEPEAGVDPHDAEANGYTLVDVSEQANNPSVTEV